MSDFPTRLRELSKAARVGASVSEDRKLTLYLRNNADAIADLVEAVDDLGEWREGPNGPVTYRELIGCVLRLRERCAALDALEGETT